MFLNRKTEMFLNRKTEMFLNRKTELSLNRKSEMLDPCKTFSNSKNNNNKAILDMDIVFVCF